MICGPVFPYICIRSCTWNEPVNIVLSFLILIFTFAGFFLSITLQMGFFNVQFYHHLQGVPRNMTVARRIECRLWTLSLFVTFSRQPTLTCMILVTLTTKLSKEWHFQSVVCLFVQLSILPDILRILFRFQFERSSTYLG